MSDKELATRLAELEHAARALFEVLDVSRVRTTQEVAALGKLYAVLSQRP